MNISGVTAEYNPFHNGHKYHLSATKIAGADSVVCVMSGNFVQRGECAFCEKHIRARQAVKNGADVVIELPLKYAVSSADMFAFGAVSVLKELGVISHISFGASAEKETLSGIAEIFLSEKIQEKINCEMQNKGCSFPKAQAAVLRKETQYDEKILDDPNNLLAVEYIKAMKKLDMNADIITVKRKGAFHDNDTVSKNFMSAKKIRELLYSSASKECISSKIAVSEDVLTELYEIIKDGKYSIPEKNAIAVLSRLQMLGAEDFIKINNVNQGLENRIVSVLEHNCNYASICDNVKTKRYTHSRIRRIFLNAALGITKEDVYSGINYIRVLAFNDKGREIIKQMSENSSVPVIMNISDLKKYGLENSADARLDILSGRFYNLTLKTPYDKNPEIFIPAVYVKD